MMDELCGLGQFVPLPALFARLAALLDALVALLCLRVAPAAAGPVGRVAMAVASHHAHRIAIGIMIWT
jgi:hypothetical protein